MELEVLAQELAETFQNGNLSTCLAEIRGNDDCCLLAILVYEELPIDSRSFFKRLLGKDTS